MKAMILAAGLGTRLRPPTEHKPKALVEINGITLLEHLIRRFKASGINEIIINAHHFSDQIIDFIEQNNHFDIRIEISIEKDLLDTGGGLKRAAWFFDDNEPFIMQNVDVITDLDYQDIYEAHLQSGALATLAVRKRETSRYLLFDHSNLLCGWENTQDKEKIIVRSSEPLDQWSFMGIHVLSPKITEFFGTESAFSIIHKYLELAKTGVPIYGFPADSCQWMDVGRRTHLEQAAKLMAL